MVQPSYLLIQFRPTAFMHQEHTFSKKPWFSFPGFYFLLCYHQCHPVVLKRANDWWKARVGTSKTWHFFVGSLGFPSETYTCFSRALTEGGIPESLTPQGDVHSLSFWLCQPLHSRLPVFSHFLMFPAHWSPTHWPEPWSRYLDSRSEAVLKNRCPVSSSVRVSSVVWNVLGPD